MEYVAGLEKLVYGAFVRRFMSFKKSDIPKKIISLDDSVQLATNSVLHMLDNAAMNTTSADMPKVISNPLLINESFKKYIFHNTDILQNPRHPLYKKFTGKYTLAGIQKSIIEFTREYKQYVAPVRSFDAVFAKQNILAIINHNPLWRLNMIGKFSEYKKFEIIFRAILAKIDVIPGDKYQFIEIPISNRIYTKADFARPLKKEEISAVTVNYVDDFSYFFLIHLFSLLTPDSELSLFNKLSADKYEMINIIFTANGKAIIYNLSDILNMAKNKNTWYLFARHISLLKLYASNPTLDINTLVDMADDNFEEYITNNTSNINADSTITTVIPDAGTISVSDEPVTKLPDPVVDKADQISFVDDLTAITNDYIDNMPEKTPAQKNRLKKISERYKTVKIGDSYIADILNSEPDISMTDSSIDVLKGTVPDDMLKSSIVAMDSLYMDNLYEKDLAQTLISFSKNGLYLIDYKTEDEVNALNQIRHHTVKYEDMDGTQHTIKFKLPIVREDDTFLVNGIKSRMKKQQINLPIVKISPVRVSLAASYKTLVERNVTKAHSFLPFIETYIKKINKEKSTVRLSHNGHTYQHKLPYEYTAISFKYESMIFGKYSLFFDYNDRANLLNIPDDVLALEKEFGVAIGAIKGNTQVKLFMGLDNLIRVVHIVNKEVMDTTSIFELLSDHTDIKRPLMISEWTDLKILDQKLPMIFILGYKFGLTNMLKYLGVNFMLYDKGTHFEKNATDMIVRFADKTLVYNRYPLEHSLIINGLFQYKTNKIEYAEFDTSDIYYELLANKGISTNYIKGIDTFFELWLDPITRDILLQMGEPTNIRDLLIRATSMLVTQEHINPASIANHRMRSYERFNSILYDEVARRIATNKRQYGGKASYSINPEAVFQRIIQDQSVVLTEEINPVHEIKEITGVTFSGTGGRDATSFVLADRQYPNDAKGIISEATPDSGKVAINVQTSMDPNITNIRGMYNTDIKTEDIDPTELLSVTGLLFPHATNDDQRI